MVALEELASPNTYARLVDLLVDALLIESAVL